MKIKHIIGINQYIFSSALCLFFSIPFIGNSQVKEIAYQLLDIEVNAGVPYSEKANERLESIFKEFEKFRQANFEHYNDIQNLNTALSLLGGINEIIISNGFEIVNNDILTTENTLLLSQSLEQKKLDCDILSIIYISIGQRYQLPIYGVLVESHMLITWNDGNDLIFYFEPLTGLKYETVTFLLGTIDFFKRLKYDEIIPVYYTAIANYYIDKEMYSSSLEYAQKSIVEFEDYYGAYQMKGLTLYFMGDFVNSILEYKRAIELNPVSYRLYHNIACVYDEIGNQDSAICFYEKSLSLNPHYLASLINLSTIYFDLKYYNETEKVLTYAISEYPENPKINAKLGYLYLEQNKKIKAVECFEKVLNANLGVDVRDGVIFIINKSKHDIAVDYYNEAKNQSSQGNYENAINLYSKAIEYYPINEKQLKAEAFYNRGVNKRKINESSDAINDYTMAIKLKPGYYKAYNNRGFVYLMQEDFLQAIDDFTLTIKYDNYGSNYTSMALGNRGIAKISIELDGCDDLKEALRLGNNKVLSLINQFCK